jgi:SagB-type dehydrogenase family enzyme
MTQEKRQDLDTSQAAPKVYTITKDINGWKLDRRAFLAAATATVAAAAAGAVTAACIPTAASDPTATQMAVEEPGSAATAVASTAAMNTTPLATEPGSAATAAESTAATNTTPLATEPGSAATAAESTAATNTMPLAAERGTTTQLPPPNLEGDMSLEEALARRRSVRTFEDLPLTEAELGQLLWAGQGITDQKGHRTAPSGGALYPLELFVATEEGVFHYDPQAHQLIVLSMEDARMGLYEASGGQQSVGQAPAVFVVTAVYERTTSRFGEEHGSLDVQLEAGHATQNMLLQATALGLGSVPVAGIDATDVQEVLALPADHQPLYLVPVGHRRGGD